MRDAPPAVRVAATALAGFPGPARTAPIAAERISGPRQRTRTMDLEMILGARRPGRRLPSATPCSVRDSVSPIPVLQPVPAGP
jgi:hypothetical protein